MNASPYLLLTLTTLFWAGNAVVSRALHTLLPPATMAFWRWVLALLLLLPFVLRPMYEQRALLRANWVRLALLGALGVGCYNTFLYAALQTTTATNGVLINSMTPLLIVLIGRLLFGVRMTGRQQAGILLSLAGVVGIVSRGDVAVLMRLDFNQGDLLLVGGSLTWAMYTVLLRWRPAGIDTLAFLGATVVGGIVLLMLPLYLVELASARVAVWNAASGCRDGLFRGVSVDSFLSVLEPRGAAHRRQSCRAVPVSGAGVRRRARRHVSRRAVAFLSSGRRGIDIYRHRRIIGRRLRRERRFAKHIDRAGGHGLIGHLPAGAEHGGVSNGRRSH